MKPLMGYLNKSKDLEENSTSQNDDDSVSDDSTSCLDMYEFDQEIEQQADSI